MASSNDADRTGRREPALSRVVSNTFDMKAVTEDEAKASDERAKKLAAQFSK